MVPAVARKGGNERGPAIAFPECADLSARAEQAPPLPYGKLACQDRVE